ncbi:MarR family winged helix-turn-helix transcriptional regulator [Streptomyces sp. NBC_01803]|uniref:MarR family winged helix-turn-helix transcriptional regulator n=1 Tax=Streptomyces sp. NBC_01803 TaxID=2975946 RepID=UPI002DD80AB9|nr:MarR family transcriptional regulator [Streptomyces sp. NBC_01803]
MSADAVLIDRWRSLLAQYSRIAHELDRALQEHGLTVSDYEALDRLLSDQDRKVRVQDLVDEMHLSQSAMSRMVARLEKCGLVCRGMCDIDRRGVFVSPTEAGRKVHAEARGTYLAVLAKHLG